jgi:hypothetical protein
MKNSTPMFPGFHLQTLRRKPRSEAQKLADKLALLQQKSIKQVGEVCSAMPQAAKKAMNFGCFANSGRRSSQVTSFWATKGFAVILTWPN